MTDEEIERALASLNISKEAYEVPEAHTGDEPENEPAMDIPRQFDEMTTDIAPDAASYASEEAIPEMVGDAATNDREEAAGQTADWETESGFGEDFSRSDAEDTVWSTEDEKCFAADDKAASAYDVMAGDILQSNQTEETVEEQKKTSDRVRIFNFSTKLLMLCILPMILVCVVTVLISASSLRSGIETEIQNSLKIVATTLEETYSTLYEGDYHKAKDGAVYKGEKKISGNNKLFKSIEEKTGFKSTMFWEDMRLLTTVKNEKGAAATGTKLDKELCEQVEGGEGQEVFIKGTEIFGTDFYVFYQPLKNEDGTIIGAIEVMIETDSVNATINGQIVKFVIVSIVLMIAAAAIILVMSRRMVATMTKTKEFLGRIADGELTAAADERVLKQNDELGDIYGMSVRLQTELRKIVNHIMESVDDLITSANLLTDMAQKTRGSVENVLDAVEGISKGTVTQAEGTTTANNNVERIGQQIGYITDEVESLTTHARQMSEAEKRSEQIIVQLNASNEDTKVSVNKVADQIGIMNKSIQSIHSAVELIQSIADETDLLSLNASIEAARAGEAGRGFAVVAEQICKLADQSNRSAEEIEKIINEVMHESNRMVEIMGEVSENMDQQQKKLEETKITYSAVAEGVEKSLNNIENIKDQMGVLNTSGNEIRGVVEDLAVISDQNASSVQSTMGSAEDMSATMGRLENSSEKLLHLADRLNDALQIFKI